MERTANDIIQQLLTDAANAHGRYEAEELGGVHDDEWPAWYAKHITDHLMVLGYRLVRV